MKKRLGFFLVAACLLILALGIFASADEPTVRINGVSLGLQDRVCLLYRVVVTGDTPKEYDVTMQFSTGSPTDGEWVYTEVEPYRTEGESTYFFSYNGQKPMQMIESIYSRAVLDLGETVVYSDFVRYSVLDYAHDTRNSNKVLEGGEITLGEMVEEILHYGAMSQKYFAYRTDRLATDEYAFVRAENGRFSDGIKTAIVFPGDSVTLKADAPASGHRFDHWEDKNGVLLSKEAIVTLSPTADEVYRAVFVEFVYSNGLEFDSNGDGTCALIGMGDCTDTDIVIPEHSPDGDLVTSIEGSAFSGEAITSITIPAGIVEIGRNAFKDCTALTDVYYMGTTTQWEAIDVRSGNAPLTNATLHSKEEMPLNPQCTHHMEAVSANAATCTENGNIAYWHCAQCDKFFGDAEGTVELSSESIVIPATGHSYSDDWSYDDGYHWHEMNCVHKEDEDIDPKADYAEHVYDEVTHFCVCGKKETVALTFVDYNNRTLRTLKIEYGSEVIFAEAVGTPERNGYAFTGWTLDDVATDLLIATVPVTLKATYARAYTVLFVSDNAVYDSQVVIEGESAVAPAVDPQMDGYIFSGWEDYSNVTSNRIVYAIYTPIQYTVKFVMPDGSLIGEAQDVDYGGSATAPEAPEYWFDWDSPQMYLFTNWVFDGTQDWTYADVEAEVVSQYQNDSTKNPEIVMTANYATEYGLPVIVVKERSRQNPEDLVTKLDIGLVLPSDDDLKCYLYAIDLRFTFGEGMSITRDEINTGAVIYNDTASTNYNNKSKTFGFMWSSGLGNGATYTQQNIVETIEFSIADPSVTIGEGDFVLDEASSIVIAASEAAAYNEMQRITPVVVYR